MPFTSEYELTKKSGLSGQEMNRDLQRLQEIAAAHDRRTPAYPHKNLVGQPDQTPRPPMEEYEVIAEEFAFMRTPKLMERPKLGQTVMLDDPNTIRSGLVSNKIRKFVPPAEVTAADLPQPRVEVAGEVLSPGVEAPPIEEPKAEVEIETRPAKKPLKRKPAARKRRG